MKKQQKAGKSRRHDATFWRDGAYFEKPYWHWGSELPKVRAGWKRTAGWLSLALTAYGWFRHRTGTEWALVCVLGPVAGSALVVCFRRLEEWQHYRTKVKPLAYTLVPVLDQPISNPRSWLHVPQDYATREDAEVVIDVPPDFTGADTDMADIKRAYTAKLGIPDPDVTPRLGGRNPRLVFTQSQPPPSLVTWEQIAAEVTAAASHELVTGIGRRAATVKVSVETDSPHFGISMGTGAGKSNLAAFWLVQRLRLGDIAMILDAKHFSHPWAFKDMDAEYGLLPNVRYARWIPDLNDAMLWLGQELSDRTLAAERVINAKGDLLRDVGPRLWVIAEEMNLATPLLKQHWADVRGKEDVKKSPALTGLGAVAFAGRAVKMHLIVIGQQLTAETLGGGSVRENIGVRCLARYTQNSWKMQAGDIPMPPSPSVPGRVQCIASGGVDEVQVPLMDLEQVRELAMGGAVTPAPAGMPGTGREAGQVGVPGFKPIDMSPDQPGVLGMTLAEAIARGILRRSKDAARKAAQRPGFPVPLSEPRPGVASLYRPSDLAAWEQNERQFSDS